MELLNVYLNTHSVNFHLNTRVYFLVAYDTNFIIEQCAGDCSAKSGGVSTLGSPGAYVLCVATHSLSTLLRRDCET